MLRRALAAVAALAVVGGAHTATAVAAGPVPLPQAAPELSPKQRMERRFPQPVRVGALIGLPVLDFDDRALGSVGSVVRTTDGKIKLIVPYGGFLGWGRRPVAVPIEVVAIAARQIAALDMTRAEFEAAPAWADPQSRALAAGETIHIGLYRR
jgi:hypothetical protein